MRKKHLVMNQLFVDKTSHFGAKVLWHYIYLADHDELYMVKEIKQMFKVLWFKIYVTTSIHTFPLPSEIEPLLKMISDSEDIDLKVSLSEYKETMLKNFTEQNDSLFKELDSLEIDNDTKNSIRMSLNNTKKKVDMMFGLFNPDDRFVTQPYHDCGYTPLFKVKKGAETTLYVAKFLHDTLSIFKVNYVPIRDVNHITNVDSFYITRELATQFNKKTKKLSERSDAK